jgi:chromosome segregation ATPase
VLQSVLFFTLGFLCSGFLGLMLAPAIWRRAVTLTRKRIEASVPLTLTEIQADKDRMRAEFAMATRRLEMNLKSFRDKAAAQIVEISRSRDELRQLVAERDEKNRALAVLETKSGEQRDELRGRDVQIQTLVQKLDDAERAMEDKALEIARLGRLYEEASFASSSRQIELIARESELDKMASDAAALREARKDAERRLQEVANENQALREAVKEEKRRSDQSERKVERLTANLQDREETLDRREKELTRLREKMKGDLHREEELNGQLLASQAEKLESEKQIAGLTAKVSTLLGEDTEKVLRKLTAERDRLRERLTTANRENRRLKEELAARPAGQAGSSGKDGQEGALLREQMNDLAAEVIRLTARLDGPDSPIAKALDVPARNGDASGSGEAITSLADRVRALQRAASAG